MAGYGYGYFQGGVPIGSNVNLSVVPPWAALNYKITTGISNVVLNADTETIINVADRDFSSDTGWWMLRGQTTIDGGVANLFRDNTTISGIQRTSLLVVDRWYKLTYSVKRKVSGALYADAVGAIISSTVADGKILYFKALSTTFNIVLASTGDIDIDDVSLIEVGWAGSTALYNGLITQGKTVLQATTEAAMWSYHNNDVANAAYGVLFNGYARNLFKDSHPDNLDVPLESEFAELLQNGGNKLKATGTVYWATALGTNTTKFNALGGASRNADGTFNTIKETVSFWADTNKVLKLYHNSDVAEIVDATLVEGHYVRLIDSLTFPIPLT